jgi:hypothetical protein
MPVAANIRIAPAATDPTAVPQSDGTAPAEIFGEIISGLADASVEGAAELPVTAEAAGTEPPPLMGECEVAEAVEQLLALASPHHAEAKPATPPRVESSKNELSIDKLLKDGAEMPAAPPESVDNARVPQALAAVLPTISPRSQHRLVEVTADGETPISSADRPQPETIAVSDLPQTTPPEPIIPVTQAPANEPQTVSAPAPAPITASNVLSAGRGGEVRATPASIIESNVPLNVPSKVPSNVPSAAGGREAAPAPAADQPSETPRIASSRTEAVVQLAFSGLESAFKAMPTQPTTARLGRSAIHGSESEPSLALPELKLTTAMTLPSINPVVAAFELTRPADVAQIGTQSAPQALDSAELLIEHQLDMAHEGEWLDQLARDITRSAGSDSSPLRFRLNPENLGSLRVEISQDRNGAAVRLTTDTEAARTIIADAQPRLIAEARAQGIRISETHVELGGQAASGDPRRQNAVFEETPLRTARSLQEDGEGDGNPTPGRSERYA